MRNWLLVLAGALLVPAGYLVLRSVDWDVDGELLGLAVVAAGGTFVGFWWPQATRGAWAKAGLAASAYMAGAGAGTWLAHREESRMWSISPDHYDLAFHGVLAVYLMLGPFVFCAVAGLAWLARRSWEGRNAPS